MSVEDTLTGARRVEKGPCIWFPGPYEEWEFLGVRYSARLLYAVYLYV